MKYYTKSSKSSYSAGLDLSETNKKNMNMLGRMKSKRKMSGIATGMMPKVPKPNIEDDGRTKRSHGLNLEKTNKRNMNMNSRY